MINPLDIIELKYKYVKRTGSRGKYRYWYQDPKTGRISQDKPSVIKPAHTLGEVRKKFGRKERGGGKELPISDRKELDIVLSETSFVLISSGRNPENAADMKLTDKQISERHKQLHNDIIKRGNTFTKVVGNYGETEDSFLVMVHDSAKKDMIKLGKKYNQDSIIFTDKGKNELIYTTGKNKGEIGMSGNGYEYTPKAKEYYTIIKLKKESVKFNLSLKEIKKVFKAFIKRILNPLEVI